MKSEKVRQSVSAIFAFEGNSTYGTTNHTDNEELINLFVPLGSISVADIEDAAYFTLPYLL